MQQVITISNTKTNTTTGTHLRHSDRPLELRTKEEVKEFIGAQHWDDQLTSGNNVFNAMKGGFFPTANPVVLCNLHFSLKNQMGLMSPEVTFKNCIISSGVLGIFKGDLAATGPQSVAIACGARAKAIADGKDARAYKSVIEATVEASYGKHGIMYIDVIDLETEFPGITGKPVDELANLKQLAESGSIDASLELGGIYSKAIGVSKSDTQATKYFKLAYTQGTQPNASDQDRAKAAQAAYEFALSIEQRSLFSIARSFVNSDEDTAEGWFQKAADLGHLDAQKRVNNSLSTADKLYENI